MTAIRAPRTVKSSWSWANTHIDVRSNSESSANQIAGKSLSLFVVFSLSSERCSVRPAAAARRPIPVPVRWIPAVAMALEGARARTRQRLMTVRATVLARSCRYRGFAFRILLPKAYIRFASRVLIRGSIWERCHRRQRRYPVTAGDLARPGSPTCCTLRTFRTSRKECAIPLRRPARPTVVTQELTIPTALSNRANDGCSVIDEMPNQVRCRRLRARRVQGQFRSEMSRGRHFSVEMRTISTPVVLRLKKTM